MEIRQVQSFVHVARLGSFSRAAETMGYSQSAITVQIRLLEEELGTKLFDRMTETKESSNRLVEEHCMRDEAVPKGAVDCMEERMPE